jgi:outer membrane protein, multidrug efflux system
MTASLTLSGCTLGPDFKLPFLNLPAKYPEPEVTTGKALVVPANWWLLYGDADLERLVSTGLARNTDVRIAIARIEEAEAFMREVSAASLFPQIDGDASASRAR